MTNFQSPYHSFCIRKSIPSSKSLQALASLAYPLLFPQEKNFILSPWLTFTLTMQTCKCSPPKGCLKTAVLCCLKSNSCKCPTYYGDLHSWIYFFCFLRHMSVCIRLVLPFSMWMGVLPPLFLNTVYTKSSRTVIHHVKSDAYIHSTVIFILLYLILLKFKIKNNRAFVFEKIMDLHLMLEFTNKI